MPKRNVPSPQRDDERVNALIRHHLEEAATHLGMVRQLSAKILTSEVREGRNVQLAKIGKYLKRLYVHHGGHPDA